LDELSYGKAQAMKSRAKNRGYLRDGSPGVEALIAPAIFPKFEVVLLHAFPMSAPLGLDFIVSPSPLGGIENLYEELILKAKSVD
jgi:hypothetical protein